MNNTKYLKAILLTTIKDLSTHKEFLSNPDTDFTRNRKFSFDQIVKFILTMEAGSIKDELYKYFGLTLDNPTASAFVQQRNKISFEAFHWLFSTFTSLTLNEKKYKGYRLLAVDGSTIPIRYDTEDTETYLDRGDSQKGYNAYHLNVSYDVLEHIYEDCIIQGQPSTNENGAFNDIVDRYHGSKAIFIADRGYESINSFEHVNRAHQNYVIRVKDVDSKTSVVRSFGVPETGEFDIYVQRILTRRNTKEIKEHPEIYKFMPKNQRFDFFEDEKFYSFECRIVRFKITEDTYETIITNLNKEIFSIQEIKELYTLRWGIETSFRELKYAVGMMAFHAKKKNSILQEIYAKLVFYNFSQRIIRTIKPKQTTKKRKYAYQMNFTRAFHTIRTFLKNKKGDKKPPDIESILAKEIEPIRLNRNDPRKVKTKSSVYFTYRLN